MDRPAHSSTRPGGVRMVRATEADVPLVLAFSCAGSLFGPRPAAEALVAHAGTDPAGFVVYFHNFSTSATLDRLAGDGAL